MIDITGKKYGLLTVIKPASQSKEKRWRWLCRCECGNTTFAYKNQLECSRPKTSCGCDHNLKPNLTHGMRYTGTYSSWQAMKNRTTSKTSKDYHRYGAVGVGLCDRWHSFDNFYEDMGERPEGTSIDRYPDCNGNYSPENCRWATPKEQARNRKDFVVINSPIGRIPLIDYAEHLGVTNGCAHMRLKRGTLDGCSKD